MVPRPDSQRREILVRQRQDLPAVWQRDHRLNTDRDRPSWRPGRRCDLVPTHACQRRDGQQARRLEKTVSARPGTHERGSLRARRRPAGESHPLRSASSVAHVSEWNSLIIVQTEPHERTSCRVGRQLSVLDQNEVRAGPASLCQSGQGPRCRGSPAMGGCGRRIGCRRRRPGAAAQHLVLAADPIPGLQLRGEGERGPAIAAETLCPPGPSPLERPTGRSHLGQNRLRSGTCGSASTAVAGSWAGIGGQPTAAVRSHGAVQSRSRACW